MKREDQRSPETVLAGITGQMSERLTPVCRHFGVCGGCQLQDLAYESQVSAKVAMLLDVLRSAGLAHLPEVQTMTSHSYGYRNRARMRVEGGEIGYSRRASNVFMSVEECPILAPEVWRAAVALRDSVKSGDARWPQDTASFEVFANAEGSAVQVSLHADATVATVDRDAPRDLRVLCDAVQKRLPVLAGGGLSVTGTPLDGQPKRVQGNTRVEIATWGAAGMAYDVGGRTYSVTRNAFFQVNRFLTEAIVQLVAGDRRGEVAWDLFAGAGLFSVALAERFRRVIAVEIGEPAATDLATQLGRCAGQHRAVRQTALAFLEAQHRPGADAPDLVVLDPPRAGLGMAAVRALIATGAREVVYVSCDAGSFARDARALVESGYRISSLHLLDLFPQTFHTETIAVLHR